MKSPFRYFNSSPEVIRLTAMMYVRFPLSPQQVEDLLRERDIWRAVDHEGEVLGVFATKRRNRRAALHFLKPAMKRYGQPAAIVTDRLRS